MSRKLLGCVLFAACMLAASAAFGADAAELVREGVQLRSEGKDAQALRAFEAAASLNPSPTVTAQMAMAEQALGLWVSSERHMLEALRANADPWIEKNRKVLDGSLATVREHLGSLEIGGAPDGAEVWIDGVYVGTLPASAQLRLEIGRRQLEVRQAGHHAASRSVSIQEHTVARETVALVRVAPQAADRNLHPEPSPAPHEDRGQTQRTFGTVLLVSGGAALLFAGGAAIVSESITQSFNGNPRCDRPDLDATCMNQIGQRSTWSALAIAGLVGGGVLGATGLTLLLTAPSNNPRTPQTPRAQRPPSARCGFGGAALICAGSF